jgi:UDP-N-acetylglucosamine 2-epimerase (non-hydrolysing)
MVLPVMSAFGVKEDYNLDIMRQSQSLTTITTSVITKLETVLSTEKPDIVLVHGDTSTTFAASLAAFYQKIPVGHVEAGLRTYNKYSPYPEEMNRCLTARIANLHFAPTENNRKNLANENVTEGVFVTGNTVLDAFKTTVKKDYIFKNDALKTIDYNKKIILKTAHRRENLGAPLISICNAINRLAHDNSDIAIIYPVHLNPAVREPVYKLLDKKERIHLTEPLDVEDMHNLIARSHIVLTDSGGLQEEAPACGVPVLVLRTETERPEAVEAGTVKVVGVDEDAIYRETQQLLDDNDAYQKMARAVNPYGDGHASERIADILIKQKGI